MGPRAHGKKQTTDKGKHLRPERGAAAAERERARAFSRRRVRSARRQRLGVGPQSHKEMWGPASSERGGQMRLRSLMVVLIVAIAIAGVAVAARGHGGLHKWIMAIHGRH